MKVGLRLSLLCAASLFLTQMPAFAYQLNASSHQITVQPGSTPAEQQLILEMPLVI
jgi:hypothetical protein